MPKETFRHLPAGKRDRFVAAALDEFALHDYRAASLSRIVAAAGIAKGSVYQYFDDKLALYRHLVDQAGRTKFGFIDASLPNDAAGFFEQVRHVVFHGARFDFTHPREGSLLYLATYEPSVPEVSAELRAASYHYVRGLVAAGVRQGDLRADLDVEFAVFAVYQLSVSLRDFSFKEAVRRGSGSPVPDDELWAVLDELVGLFRRGMGAP